MSNLCKLHRWLYVIPLIVIAINGYFTFEGSATTPGFGEVGSAAKRIIEFFFNSVVLLVISAWLRHSHHKREMDGKCRCDW